MVSQRKNWELDDDFAFRNELKLIDDSYYRVFDDPDYELWKERVQSLVVIQGDELLFFVAVTCSHLVCRTFK